MPDGVELDGVEAAGVALDVSVFVVVELPSEDDEEAVDGDELDDESPPLFFGVDE